MAERDLPDALLGWSGFVGGVLDAQHAFDARFRRADIHESAGRGFGTLVCAAAPGSMFAANRDPKGDAAAIDGLIAALSHVRARRMVLVSTIAVLARFDGRQDEDTADFQTETPYGANRRRLEAFCSARFDRCLILRLPALFGPGLRKNFIFDILNPVPAMLTPERMETVLDALPADLRDPMAGLYDRDDARGLWSVDRARVAALPERARLEAVIRASFGPTNFRREIIAAWLNFYVLAQRSTEARRLLALYQRRLQSNLVHDLRPLVGARAPDIARRIGGLIDGLYLRHALDSSSETGELAARQVLAALETELGASG